MLAHMDANNFYVSCEQVFEPALRGRPVVVLSNNDGVIVARSAKARALGIDMARPFFEIEHELRRHRVHVLSSNYTLYDNMSNRLVSTYHSFADDVEIYSVDECFLSFADVGSCDLQAHGRDLRSTMQQWTGIPVGVGIAPTKTLAKLANHLAKHDADNAGVCVLARHDAITTALSNVALTDLWGVSRGFQRDSRNWAWIPRSRCAMRTRAVAANVIRLHVRPETVLGHGHQLLLRHRKSSAGGQPLGNRSVIAALRFFCTPVATRHTLPIKDDETTVGATFLFLAAELG